MYPRCHDHIGKADLGELGTDAVRQSDGPLGVQVFLVTVEHDIDFEVIASLRVGIVDPEHGHDGTEGELIGKAFSQVLFDDGGDAFGGYVIGWGVSQHCGVSVAVMIEDFV